MNKFSRFLMFVAATATLLALTACGNKGPLVMPQKPVPVEEQEVKPAAAAPVDPADAQKVQDAVEDPAAAGEGHE